MESNQIPESKALPQAIYTAAGSVAGKSNNINRVQKMFTDVKLSLLAA